MVDEQLFPWLHDLEHGSPLLPMGIARQTPDFGPESAVTAVFRQATGRSTDLVHSSARSQAAPSARVPENAAPQAYSLGSHVLDWSSRRTMHARIIDSSTSSVPLATSSTTWSCRSNSDSQSASDSGIWPAAAQHARAALQNARRRASSDAPASPAPGDGFVSPLLQLAKSKTKRTSIDVSCIDIADYHLDALSPPSTSAVARAIHRLLSKPSMRARSPCRATRCM
jgi:hypothetical protein